MNPKKGLIGFFILLFFLSGIGMSLLIVDDQKDLSSRAATILVTGSRKALPTERFVENSNLWSHKIDANLVEVRYDPVLWFPPKNSDLVFFNRESPVTVRYISGIIDETKLKALLGSDFSGVKVAGPASITYGWSRQAYSLNFLGTSKIAEVWSAPKTGMSIVVVMSSDLDRQYVEDLISQTTINPVTAVKGATTLDDSARLAALVRPSVVMILNNYCAKMNSGTKTYPFCLAQAGSGFFVNKDGYIATNGHVVTNLPETSIFYAVESGSLDAYLSDYFQEYLSKQTSLPVDKAVIDQKVKDAHGNKETLYQMAALVQNLYRNNQVKVEGSENRYFVQLGNVPIQVSKTGVNVGPGIIPAKFIDSDYKEPDPLQGFTTSDVALLKIDGENYPALPLGSIENVREGSDVLVVGYPGIVLGSNSLLLDTSANTEPTFTRGVVSSFKQAKGNKKNLIQTDASINHGNSGGPAVSSSGLVVGLATYGLQPESGAGNYNFLRDVADLKDLMAKHKIQNDTGSTYTTWKNGLNNFWVSYYRYAHDDFEKVKTLYPNHPTVSSYLNESSSKINTAEDKTPRFTRETRRLYINASGALMTFSILMVIALAISNYIDNKRRNAPVTLPPVQTF